jgi:hypothetical protein
LGDRVYYMTPHYEFAMPLSDGKALVVGRDLEGRPLPISRPSFPSGSANHCSSRSESSFCHDRRLVAIFWL